MDVAEIKTKCKPVFDKNDFVKEAFLFGSYARKEATDKSDVDVMVVLNKNVGLEFFGLYHYLEKALSKKVDVITSEEAYHIMPKSIERDKLKIYER